MEQGRLCKIQVRHLFLIASGSTRSSLLSYKKKKQEPVSFLTSSYQPTDFKHTVATLAEHCFQPDGILIKISSPSPCLLLDSQLQNVGIIN